MNEFLRVSRVDRSDPNAESAEVTLCSAASEITVFCHPCELRSGDAVPNALSALNAEAKTAYLNDWPEPLKEAASVQRLEQTGPFSYCGVGRVVDRRERTIEVLGFRVLLDCDITCEGPVEFRFGRVDL